MASSVLKADVIALTDEAVLTSLSAHFNSLQRLAQARLEEVRALRTGDLSTAAAGNSGETLAAKRARRVADAALLLPTEVAFGA